MDQNYGPWWSAQDKGLREGVHPNGAIHVQWSTLLSKMQDCGLLKLCILTVHKTILWGRHLFKKGMQDWMEGFLCSAQEIQQI